MSANQSNPQSRIQHQALRRLDLNLLTALRILLEERNVTHAAKRLFISQPALSKTLQKLRQVFGDPLFTRAAHGLVPTPLAKQLETTLPILLDQLSALVQTQEFVPDNYRGNFKIAGSETLFDELLPRLIERIQDTSINTSIHTTEIGGHFLEQLTNGELDFALHLNPHLSDEFVRTDLGHSRSMCVMRADHPLAQGTSISVDEYLGYPHVRLYLAQITPSDRGVIDELLAQVGKYRRIILETSNVTSALRVIRQSDALMVIPDAIAAVRDEALVLRALPAQLGFPLLDIVLIQHRRTLGSPAHQWLKQLIVDIQLERRSNKSA